MQAELITVRGRVQGVGFRYFVLSEAQRLGLSGYVRNQSDGAVQCFVQGPDADVELLVKALARGPAGANVTALERSKAAITNVGPFRILR